MQRAFVLVVLFAMMVGLRRQGVDLLPGETDPLTLASIGFTALFAFTIGELANGVGLPRVSGYILTGVVLGPYATGVLSDNVVSEMKMFNTLALGLIATTAGLELDLKGLAKSWKTLLFTVGFKLIFLLLLVVGTFVALEYFLSPFDLGGVQPSIAVGLVIAVLGLGTSPAIVLAVINDSKATGRMSELLLAMAVVKDLVVVVSLAVALALAKVLLVPDGHFDLHVLVHVAQELGASLGVGLVVGALCIAYIRFVHAEMLLFVVAMILTVAQLSEVLHLEVLLVFIVAGFLVRNASPHEHELLHPLETVALPVFVVFFTTAGAAVDLQGTWQVLPFAAALFAARLLAMYLSGLFGGKLGGEPPEISNRVWMGYLPQAGVTLGLILIAGAALPEQAALIATLGTAIVVINLFVGPVTLSMALKPASKAVTQVDESEPELIEDALVEGAELLDGAVEVSAPSPVGGPLAEALDFESHRLRLSQLGIADPVEQVFGELCTWFDEQINQQRQEGEALLTQFEQLLKQADSDYDRLRTVRRYLQRYEASVVPAHQLRDNVSGVLALLSSVPTYLDLDQQAMERDLQPDFWRKIRGKANYRGFPLRTALRIAIEERCLNALGAVVERANRSQALYLHRLAENVRGVRGVEDVCLAFADDLSAASDLLWSDCQHQLKHALISSMECFEQGIEKGHPWKNLRYGDVEPKISAGIEALEGRHRRWCQLLTSQRETTLVHTLLRSYEHRLQSDVSEKVAHLIEEALDLAATEAEVIRGRLESLREDCKALGSEEAGHPEWLRIQERCKQCLDRKQRSRLRRSSARLRHHVLSRHFEQTLHRLIEEVPDKAQVVGADTPLIEAGSLEGVRLVDVPLFSIVERQLTEEYAPVVITLLVQTRDSAGDAESRLREAVQVASFAIESSLKGDESAVEEGRKWILDGLNRAAERVQELEKELRQLAERAQTDLQDLPVRVFERIQGDVRVNSVLERRRLQGRSSLFEIRQRFRQVLAQGGARVRGAGVHLADTTKGLLQSRNVTAWRIRAGLEHLDPAHMSEFVNTHLPRPEVLEVAAFYQRLFVTVPLDDSRYYTVRERDPLQRLRECISSWNQGQRVSALLVGGSGSGKTSVINLVHPRLSGIHLIRLDGEGAPRQEGLIAALASELDCQPELSAVKSALERQKTAVIVDDLERWFSPSLSGVEEFENVVEMIVTCGPQVLWVMSINKHAVERLSCLYDLWGAFSHHIELLPMSAGECESFIEARHRLSGLELQHKTPVNRPIPKLLRSGSSERYFQELVNNSGGFPRAIAYLHLLSCSLEGEVVSAGRIHPVDLPFIGKLPCIARVVLAEVLRLGEMNRLDLLNLLALSERELDVSLRQLISASLLEERSLGYAIPAHLDFALSRVLAENRLLVEESL